MDEIAVVHGENSIHHIDWRASNGQLDYGALI